MSSSMIYKSSGKFLITAEYLILKGAKGLALPLKHGQILSIEKNNSNIIHWKSKVFDETWFEAKLNVAEFDILSSTDEDIAKSLQNVLSQSRILNPTFLDSGVDAMITADFNLAWGLGSSSTLINNIATWANVDPYILLENTFGGSGYDIACAGAKSPITYQLTDDVSIVEDVDFHPSFAKNIFFVYLGKKMNSRTGMSYFKEKAIYTNEDIEEVNSITEDIVLAQDLIMFEEFINWHENILSRILQIPTIKESNFSDYPYSIKSMGAWGGDFVLVTGENIDQVKKYFFAKGLDTVVSYHDIVLS